MKKKIIKCIILIVLFVLIIFIIYLKYNNNLDKNLDNKSIFNEVNININKSNNNYAMVKDANELISALNSNNIEIIEIIDDIDLGYNNIKDFVNSNVIEEHTNALTHPILKQTGVSKLFIKNKNQLVIFSKNGKRLLHTNIYIINSSNIKIDNIKMEELWEWDEEYSFDRNNWDYISIFDSNNILITNCEFSKSYDEIISINNSENVTISYSKLNNIDVDDYFFSIQFDELERNINKYPSYKYLRKKVGLSKKLIKRLSTYQKKLLLIGGYDYISYNKNIIVHDSLFYNARSRIPMARNSTVYLYNVYAEFEPIEYNKKFDKIDNKFATLYSNSTHAVKSIQNSSVVVQNSIFKGYKYSYLTFNENVKDRNDIGEIILCGFENEDIDENLEQKLEKIAGNITK